MTKRKLFSRIGLYFSFILILFCILKFSGLSIEDVSAESIRMHAHNNILLILLIMLVIMMLQNLFTFIPLIVVITMNIALFGFWQGYLYSTFCSVIGSTAIFLSIRYILPNVFKHTSLEKYNEKVEKNGFLFVFSARVLPFIPTNLINIVAGLSTMKTTHFILATTLGNLIYGFVLSATSFGLISAAHSNQLLLWIILTLALIVFIAYKWRRKHVQHS